ncbi:Hypothetical_protein [Hexamita inflata]|uniref:Hypothetical_protein n=1 Tax=Hexamita inflata TaxID=28002 RepID=A0ABP1HH67_9EUKA
MSDPAYLFQDRLFILHHCRRCIKLTLQFSLQFGDLLFERLNFLVIAFRVGDYFGLGGFVRFFLCGRVIQFIVAFFCCLRGLLFSLCFVGFSVQALLALL